MKMSLTRIFLLLSGIIYTEMKIVHVDIYLSGCTESAGDEMYELNGEEKGHADFKAEKFVMTLPEFADPFQYEEGTYETSVSNMQVCKQNLATAIKAYKNPAVTEDAPTTTIFPRDDVKVGTENTLICHVTGLFPPRLNVTWNKNNRIVTERVSASQLRKNRDGTFNQFFTLKFTPQEGDIYTCTVEHQALEMPTTREWDVEVSKEPSLGPSVFCGVGLTLGLLGVATGTFFLVKGNQCN